MTQPQPDECSTCTGYDSSTCPICRGTGEQPAQPLDLDTIQARHHLIADPAACGTCWRLARAGQPTEHPECARRAVLLPPPDQPSDEDLADLTDEQKTALPARFHTPVWEGLAAPHSWVCAVCYGDGWTTAWPCKTALQHGEAVFTPEHQAARARQDVPALIARVAELEQQLAGVWPCICKHPAGEHKHDYQPATSGPAASR